MENRLYYWELACYGTSGNLPQRAIGKSNFIDLSLLPKETMREEYRRYFLYRGGQVSLNTICHEKAYYKQVCQALQLRKNIPDSFLGWQPSKWIELLKIWMLQNGIPFYKEKETLYGTICRTDAPVLQHLKRFLRFIQPEDMRPEREKDIWALKKLDIPIKENPIYKTETLDFTGILQEGLREEVKQAIFLHIKYEKIGTVKRELTSIRKFSGYLMEKGVKINSCADVDRDLLEEYLVYINTNGSSGRGNSDDILKLRAVLESIGKLYGYSHLESLFINTDIPPEVQPVFRAYSDEELKRLNAHITKLDIQLARCMVIHQMLGTRISDTLTLHTDCLSKRNGLDIIRIDQVKTRTFEKPISAELVALIQKAIDCTYDQYGKTEYIFVDAKAPSRPLQYTTIKHKVLRLIKSEDLRDDDGKLFKFSSHMFRRSYGVKLTEMHLDDWTIAKLLGHKNISAVKHYRKMSNQLLAEETRKAREQQTRILLANLDGWGEEYEQIRQDD